MANSPVVIFLGKEDCGACIKFYGDYRNPNSQSEFSVLCRDQAICSKYWLRHLHIGNIDGTIHEMPECFKVVQFVPAVLVATSQDFSAVYDLNSDTPKTTSTMNFQKYEGPMQAQSIKAWLLSIFPQMS